MRINQKFLDAAGTWRAARCVSAAFNPAQWNPIVTNWSGFGVYRIQFEDALLSYCTPLMKLPVAGTRCPGGWGRWAAGLVFQISLPPKEFEAMSSPAIREHMHRFSVCRRRHSAIALSGFTANLDFRCGFIDATRWRRGALPVGLRPAIWHMLAGQQ